MEDHILTCMEIYVAQENRSFSVASTRYKIASQLLRYLKKRRNEKEYTCDARLTLTCTESALKLN